MSDLGAPASYLTLADGTDVFSSDGEKVGRVEHVLADEEVDIFDGLVIDRSVLPGAHRFCDAAHVERIYDRGVVLTLDRAGVDGLPKPGESPAVLEADPDDTAPDDLGDKLRRAWDVISGRG
ncbi:DUF2171 domain-containing protein [Thermoleophilia bacterium SCSIO 60948]|nr:DUF2171 domain-containing protein [Thermoleophilia bacterium SCSIO 60948]